MPLSGFSGGGAAAVAIENISVMKRELSFAYESYDAAHPLPERDRLLAEAAERATEGSHAPYSHFRVGAAARLASGRIVSGSNIESEVFPSGLCAERTLLYHVQACHAGDAVEAVAIASDPSPRECYPCGACRQTLLDVERRQGSPIRIIMSGGGTATVVASAADLLPFSFKL